MEKNIPQVDWNAIFHDSVLDIFRVPVPKKPKTRLIYDFAMQIDEVILLFLVGDAEVTHEEGVVYDKPYQQAYYQLVQTLAQRHKKCLKNLPSEIVTQAHIAQSLNPQKYDSKNMPQVFFIGISTLVSYHEAQNYLIGYEFNHAFFEEKFVFDRDEAYHLLQLFSLSEWQVIIERLTPSDLVAFLKYHRQAMLHDEMLQGSVALAEAFLQDRKFFERAWQVEKSLQKLDYLPRVSPRLQQAIYKNPTTLSQLASELQRVSAYWQPLLMQLIQRQQRAKHPISQYVIQQLLLQSSYTRYKILEPVLNYNQFSQTQHAEGILYHEHAYHKVGQHFVVIIYGAEPNSDFFPHRVYQHYPQILQIIANRLINKNMTEIFLLGVNLLEKDEDNQPFIEMDVFYQDVR